MRPWLSQLFRRYFRAFTSPEERILALERETQELRLELEGRDRAFANLKQELERYRRSRDEHTAVACQEQIEHLLTDAAAPVSQLLTQAYLVEVDGRPVAARDVLAVARRLVRVLADAGLEHDGDVGQTVPFDPNRHEPLSRDVTLAVGQPVVVRFVGLAFRGKILRKAGVEQAGE
jgi:molecular chaperone GrpE (heat shock protein)